MKQKIQKKITKKTFKKGKRKYKTVRQIHLYRMANIPIYVYDGVTKRSSSEWRQDDMRQGIWLRAKQQWVKSKISIKRNSKHQEHFNLSLLILSLTQETYIQNIHEAKNEKLKNQIHIPWWFVKRYVYSGQHTHPIVV